MRFDVRRGARGVVLAAWAGFFIWLRGSGDITRYLGPRTYWVVTFGAIVLTAGALAHFATLHRSRTTRIHWRESLGLLLLVVPIVAVIVVPRAELGALAASNRTAAGGLASVSSVIPEPDSDRAIEFIDIHYANESASYASTMGIVEGLPIELVGFVTHPDEAAGGSFALTRFYVSCCAADAIPYSVIVDSGSDFPDDTWLKVSGNIREAGGRFLVSASRTDRIAAPSDPYLY